MLFGDAETISDRLNPELEKVGIIEKLAEITKAYAQFNESIEKLYHIKEKAVGYKEGESEWMSDRKKTDLSGTPFKKRTEERISR